MSKLGQLLGGEAGVIISGQEKETLAGFVAAQLGCEVREGASFGWQGLRFEVIDMDLRRIDKVLVMPCPRKT